MKCARNSLTVWAYIEVFVNFMAQLVMPWTSDYAMNAIAFLNREAFHPVSCKFWKQVPTSVRLASDMNLGFNYTHWWQLLSCGYCCFFYFLSHWALENGSTGHHNQAGYEFFPIHCLILLSCSLVIFSFISDFFVLSFLPSIFIPTVFSPLISSFIPPSAPPFSTPSFLPSLLDSLGYFFTWFTRCPMLSCIGLYMKRSPESPAVGLAAAAALHHMRGLGKLIDSARSCTVASPFVWLTGRLEITTKAYPTSDL